MVGDLVAEDECSLAGPSVAAEDDPERALVATVGAVGPCPALFDGGDVAGDVTSVIGVRAGVRTRDG
jgi:hypothetical protein